MSRKHVGNQEIGAVNVADKSVRVNFSAFHHNHNTANVSLDISSSIIRQLRRIQSYLINVITPLLFSLLILF